MNECVFCRIAAKQEAAALIYDSDDVIAFNDSNPSAPTHILIVPKRHIPAFMEIEPADAQILSTWCRPRNS